MEARRKDGNRESKMTEIEIAYLAGIFDGEGYISIESPRSKTSACGRNIKLRIGIANTNLDLLQWIQSEFGGLIFDKHGPAHRRKCYDLQLKASGAEKFVRKVYPFLKIKKLQAEVALKFRESFHHTDKRRISDELVKERFQAKTDLMRLNKGDIINVN